MLCCECGSNLPARQVRQARGRARRLSGDGSGSDKGSEGEGADVAPTPPPGTTRRPTVRTRALVPPSALPSTLDSGSDEDDSGLVAIVHTPERPTAAAATSPAGPHTRALLQGAPPRTPPQRGTLAAALVKSSSPTAEVRRSAQPGMKQQPRHVQPPLPSKAAPPSKLPSKAPVQLHRTPRRKQQPQSQQSQWPKPPTQQATKPKANDGVTAVAIPPATPFSCP